MAALSLNGWFSRVFLAAAFSLAAAYYASLIFAPHRAPTELPRWQQAVRIAASENEPNAYFRYRMQLAATPRKAILTFAAPDAFELFVNGTSVAKSAFASVETTGVYDLAPYLVPGENVIAVAVIRDTYPGPATLLAEGYMEGADGQRMLIASGPRWRASTTEQWQREGSLAWYEREFDDGGWGHAGVAMDDGRVFAPLAITPTVLANLQAGDWIWLPDLAARDGVFRREIMIAHRPIEYAWLGVSTTATYSIAINGKPVVEAVPTREFLDTYAIASFLRPGNNRIEISVHNETTGGQLAIGGLARAGNQSYGFSSAAGWRAATGEVDAQTVWSAPGKPATVLPMNHKIGRVDAEDDGLANRLLIELPAPIVRFVETLPTTDMGEDFFALLPWLAVVLALNLAGAALFTYLARPLGWGQGGAACAYLLPQTVLLFPLIALLLARYDVRVDPATVIAPFWLVLGAVILVVWWGAILVEAHLRAPEMNRGVNETR